MGEIGDACEKAEPLTAGGAPDISTFPARHRELNCPNLVSLSPLSEAALPVKPSRARTK
jgi:hypothetical protein